MTVAVLLCDADGNLFASEEPAFAASCVVVNRLLADHGIERTFTPDELRAWALGRNFRGMATDLVPEVDPEALERWIDEERRTVTAHLAEVLRPDPAVTGPLTHLATRHRLAIVSSSARSRLAACCAATGLDDLFPPDVHFSAEDSLPVPTSKPDPAIYRHAGRELGVSGGEALAVEDATAGVLSAVAAGFETIGNLQFVASGERDARRDALLAAGASVVVGSWAEIVELLESRGHPADESAPAQV